MLVQNGVCVFSHRGPGRPTNYQANSNKILRILRYPRYIYTAKTLYGDTGELIIEELLQRGEMTMSRTVKTVADRLTQNMEGQYSHVSSRCQNLAALLLVLTDEGLIPDGQCMDYSEVSSAFCKLVETHFLQRCPPVAAAGKADGAAPATPATQAGAPAPAPTPESFPDCYRVPQVTIRGQGKRRLSSEDVDQRNAKKARVDSEVDVCFIVI